MTISVTFNLTILYLVAANILAILVYAAVLKFHKRAVESNLKKLNEAVVGYFRSSGVEVSSDCVGRLGGRRFIAFIDSEPLKRFRYSHIVEISLRSHVLKVCGLELERVYWRFPIKEKDPSGTDAGEQDKPADGKDDYISAGLERLKAHPGYDIGETSWEQFRKAARLDE